MTRFLFGSSAGGHVATPVTIANGGTGQTSAQAALDALAAASGSLVQGDIFIVDSSTNLVRLARGTDNYILKMNGSNPNWEAETSGGQLELIEEHEATGAENSYTITADMTAAKYTSIIVQFRGESTAQLAMQASLDGTTTDNYHYMQNLFASGTQTTSEVVDGDIMPLASTAVIVGADVEIIFQLVIALNSEDNGTASWQTWGKGNVTSDIEFRYGQSAISGDLATILISTTTSTWKTGSYITTYGVKRT